jgi:hypothetical protein
VSGTYDVLGIMGGYQGAAALTAACQLGVFDALADGPLGHDEVAAMLATDTSATRALLDALVGLDLLRASQPADGAYALTDDGRRLTAGGDLRLVAMKEAFFARVWLDLGESVRTGKARIAPWTERLVADPDQSRAFLRALVVLARETGLDVTALPGVIEGARVADLGGGLGSYAVPLAEAGAQVTLVDLPTVTAWAHEELDDLDPDVRDRITLAPVDLLAPGAADRIGAGYDLVVLSHLLHEFDDAGCATVLAAARTITCPGGRVAVFELPGDPESPIGPMFDLMMKVETGASARRLGEVVALLERAGLTEIQVSADHPLPHGVVVGTR